jgi:hypothetical protein
MAPGRMTSLRISGYSIAKPRHRASVLSTRHSFDKFFKLLRTNGINAEEKVPFRTEKALTKMRIRSIVKKVPRGLRNSKPAET